MKKGIVLVAFILGCTYVKAQLDSASLATMAMLGGGLRGSAKTGKTQAGAMDPLTAMAVLGSGAGNSKMIRMMTMMNLMGGEANKGAAQNAIAQPKATQDNTGLNPMMNTIMTLSLCKISETAGDQRFCTNFTCRLESLRRYANPNLLQCQQMMGCCFKDMRSMYIANMMKGL